MAVAGAGAAATWAAPAVTRVERVADYAAALTLGNLCSDCGFSRISTLSNSSDPAPNPTFFSLSGIVVSGSGDIYVSDPVRAIVYGFDSNGAQILTIPFPPAPLTGFGGPGGLALDAAGNIYVADFRQRAIFGFTPGGAHFFTLDDSTTPVPPDPPFNEVADVAMDADGNLFVCDVGTNTIYGFSPDRTQFLTINSTSNPPNPPFGIPGNLTADACGNIYVSSPDLASATGHVYGFRRDGTQFLTIGSTSNPAPNPALEATAGIAADGSGCLYVADAGTPSTVYGFSQDGTQFLTINSATHPTLDPPFASPSGVALDPSGRLYVTDLFRNTLHVFECA